MHAATSAPAGAVPECGDALADPGARRGEGRDDGDEALLQRFAQGDAPAFERLYERHERAVYRFLLRSVAIPALADELLQEVWMSVIRGAPNYQPRARFSTWLYLIARTRLIDHWRAREPAQLLSLDEAPQDGGAPLAERIAADDAVRPDEIAIDRARARAFACAVQDLPAAQREALLLHLDSGLSLAQVAEVTGAGVETVKSRLRYASARLREQLHAWRQEAPR